MQITLNGQNKEFRNIKNINELISYLGLEIEKIAVEQNLEIVPKSLYEQTALNEGDIIEIIEFVGGG